MDQSVMPAARFEWERLVRRMVLPKPVKLLALVLATYADPDGSRVRPGNDVLADVIGDSEKNVRRVLATLRGLDLLTLVSRGGGRGGKGKAAEYRLTIPADLLDRIELLTPGERKPPDTQMSAQSETNGHVSPDIQASGQLERTPVDNSPVTALDGSVSLDIQMSSETTEQPSIDRTSRAPPTAIDRTFSSIDRTSRCPTTSHIHQPPMTNLVVTTQRKYRPRARRNHPHPTRSSLIKPGNR